ncbi:hypothetical protein, partial [Planosporangium thailandense]|uniref:hypothetical protein n=1 Tax=Planosporangium thailandense TaxID=765197 RepID=UPI00197C5A74
MAGTETRTGTDRGNGTTPGLDGGTGAGCLTDRWVDETAPFDREGSPVTSCVTGLRASSAARTVNIPITALRADPGRYLVI